MAVFTLQKKQRKLFALSGNFLPVSLHDYLLLPQSELVSTLWNDVVTKRQQTPTSLRLTLIKNFMRLLKACGNFSASCVEYFWASLVSKFLRVNHKGSAKIRHFRFLRWLACSWGATTCYATFCTCIIFGLYCMYSFPFQGHAFSKENIKDMVKLLESNVLICCPCPSLHCPPPPPPPTTPVFLLCYMFILPYVHTSNFI